MKHQLSPRLAACVLSALALLSAPLAARAAEAPKPAAAPASAQKPAAAPVAQQKPKEDPKAWKLAPDWKVEVLAEKPSIHFPSVVTTAPDGRIFMAEDPMDMIGPSNVPADRILCIYPDGHRTVFAEKLNAVFGLQYIDGKVYVHHTPKISVFTDENGVGTHRVDFVNSDNPAPNKDGTGFNDHVPSNFRLAMDGYLYMSTGDKGIFGAESNIDHRKIEIRGGGVARFRPDGTGLEVYATGTRNHLDISINAEDEIFTLDNTDDGLGWWTRFTHMVDGGYYGYPYDYRPSESDGADLSTWNAAKEVAEKAKQEWEKANKDKPEDQRAPKPAAAFAQPYKPWTLWRMAEYGGGSPCGATGYNEDGLPPEYRGNLIHCEWGQGEIARFVVERDGGTYKVVKREMLLKGGPGSFRPVGITVSPDGMGFLIADWNYSGWMNKNEQTGRLLKLTYTGKPSQAAPKPAWYIPAGQGQKFDATTSELLAGLSHPAESVRLVAQRRLAERGHDSVSPLVELLQNASAPAYARWHAIWALDMIDGGKEGRRAIVAVLADEKADVSVRMQGARELGTRQAPEGVTALVAALSDPSAALRFRAAIALGRMGDANSVAALLAKLPEPDLFTHYATFTALNHIGKADPSAWSAIVAALSSNDPAVRNGAALAMRETYDLSLVKSLTAYITDYSHPEAGRVLALATIAPLQKQRKPWDGVWWGTMPARGKPAPREVEWPGTGPVTGAIKGALDDSSAAVRHAAVEALQIAPDPTVAVRLIAIFKAETDVPARKAILKALAAGKSPEAGAFVATLLKDPAANPPLISDAIGVARDVGGPEMTQALMGLVGAKADNEFVISALAALSKLPDPKNVAAIGKRLDDADGRVVAAACVALGTINNDAVAEALVPRLKDKRPEVIKAVAAALGTNHAKSVQPALIAAAKEPHARTDAIMALTKTPDMRAIDAYLDGIGDKNGDLRRECRHAIENLHEKALPVIEARLESDPISMQGIVELQHVYEKFIPVDQRAKDKLFQFDTKSLSPEAFATFAHGHAGSAENGKKIFQNVQTVGCIRCHKVGNDGGEVGPALTGVGTKYDRNALIDSVVYPSKQIADGFGQTIVKLKNSRVETGIVRVETEAELTLVDSGTQKIVIKKSDIVTRKPSPISLMPEGLYTAIKPEEFADLISYLESLKDKPAEAVQK